MPGTLTILDIGTQEELHNIAATQGSVYVGSTDNPQQRAYAYESEGFSGAMYVAKNTNMMKAEDRLLQIAFETGGGRHNTQRRSNAAQGPGYKT